MDSLNLFTVEIQLDNKWEYWLLWWKYKKFLAIKNLLSGPKGQVLLVVGGRGGSSALASTELFDYPGLKMGWGIWYLCFCIWDDRFSTWYVDMVYLVFGCLTLLYKFSHLKWENLKIWKVSFFSGICLEKSRVSSLTKVPNHKHLIF